MTSLGDWVAHTLGYSVPTKLTPYSGSMTLAVTDCELLCGLQELDEEGVTSCFLGLLISSLRLASLAFASNAPQGAGAAVQWAQYGKYGIGEGTEAKSGADLCLVRVTESGKYLVAMFQAKLEDESKPGYILIDRKPKKRKDKVVRETQFTVLYDTATKISLAVIPQPTTTIPASVLGQPEVDNDLNWVYYLGYMHNGLRCRPLSQMETNLTWDKKNGANRAWLDEEDLSSTLLDVLVAESKDFRNEVFGWLEMTLEQLNKHLPQILNISDLLLVKEGGKGGLEVLNEGKLLMNDRHPYPGSAFETEAPLPELKPRSGLRR